ncbi:MAG: carbohydrate ABC transporter permease [Christensenellales bacterium]|jgi:multiple sugar transport system permease protein|nr:carbohydrate ABC transporter permease [Candidatus Limiplasma sp.]
MKAGQKKLDSKVRMQRTGKLLGRIVFYVVCLCLAYQLLYPVLYMISMSIREPSDMNDPSIIWVAKHFTLDNFADAIKSMNFWNAFRVSLTLCIVCGVLDVFSCAIAGYGFARFDFWGKKALFVLVIFTMVVPTQTLVLPLYMRWRYADFGGIVGLFNEQGFVNLIGTLWPLIIPAALAMGVRSGLYIFIYRQFFINLPVALEDAAYIDGAGPYRTFFSIMLPNIKNAIITVFLFSFVWNWGEYYLSKQFLGSTDRSIMVALSAIRRDLASLSSLAGTQIGSNPEKVATRVMAGCLLTAAPMLIMFIFTQRFLADSIEHIGIK